MKKMILNLLQRTESCVEPLKLMKEAFFSLPVNEWKDLPNDDKRFIQRYNAKVKHNEDLSKLVVPDGLLEAGLEEIK